jgi:PQQ-like domain
MLRLRTFGAFALAGVLALSASIMPAGGAALANNDWFTAGRSGARTGFNRDGGLTASLVSSMPLRWSASGGRFSAPIVVRNQVVVADNAVNGRSRLEAYNLATGALNWSVDYGASSGATVGSPASDGVRAFVMIERPSGSLWRYDLGVYDLATGAKVWALNLGTTPSRLGPKPVLTVGGYVYLQRTFQNAFRTALKYSGGGVFQWAIQESTAIRTFAISGGVLFNATQSAIYRYDADTSVYLGQFGVPVSSIAITGNAMYYVSDAVVGAVDVHSFFALWSKPITPDCGAFVRVVTSGLAMASRCASTQPVIVDSITGSTSPVLRGMGVGDVPIAASKQVVIAVSPGGGLKAWSLLDGTSLAIRQPTAPARLSGQSGPIIAGGVIVVPEVGRLEVIG